MPAASITKHRPINHDTLNDLVCAACEGVTWTPQHLERAIRAENPNVTDIDTTTVPWTITTTEA